MKLRWKKMLVSLGAFAAVNWCAFSWGLARAQGTLESHGLQWGRSLWETATFLDDLRGAEGQGAPAHLITLNGADVRIQTGAVSARQVGLAALVARAGEHCRTPFHHATVDDPIEFPAPVFQWVGHDEAFVYCMKPKRAWTESKLIYVLEELQSADDLTEWGVFQGAYFRRTGEQISILSAEVLGGLSPETLFPADRDAMGRDFAELPAPTGRRLLAVAHNHEPALNIYHSSGSPAQALDDFYQRTLESGLNVQRARAGKASAFLVRSSESAYVVTSGSAASGSNLVVARLPR